MNHPNPNRALLFVGKLLCNSSPFAVPTAEPTRHREAARVQRGVQGQKGATMHHIAFSKRLIDVNFGSAVPFIALVFTCKLGVGASMSDWYHTIAMLKSGGDHAHLIPHSLAQTLIEQRDSRTVKLEKFRRRAAKKSTKQVGTLLCIPSCSLCMVSHEGVWGWRQHHIDARSP